HPVDQPLNTITAWPRGGSFALATAFLAQTNGGFNATHSKAMDEPMTTITNTGSQQQLATASLIQTGFGERPGQSPRNPGLDKPLGTVVAGGVKHAVVECLLSPDDQERALRCAAFMINYYGNGDARSVEQPLDTDRKSTRLNSSHVKNPYA